MEYEQLLKDKWELLIQKIEEGNGGITELIQEFGEEYVVNPKFCFFLLDKILHDWVDMEEDYYPIVINWILGTYFIDEFVSFPYLFINAVKRSGKTRLLKLLSSLSFNGIYTADLTEAVLFRLPSVKQCTLMIDEAEGISAKEKSGLRLLLNSAYKRGMKIYRARKVPKSEKYIIDEFEIFMPIAIANIYGMDDVLEDRCISVILERSNKIDIINKPEFFDLDLKFNFFKYVISRIVSVGSVGSAVNMMYNNFQLLNRVLHSDVYRYQLTLYTTNTTDTTNTTNTIDKSDVNLYVKNEKNSNVGSVGDIISEPERLIREMIEKKIVGRDFECWYPLFIINYFFNQDVIDKMLETVSRISKEKRTTDIMDDRDTSVLIFLGNFVADKNKDEFFSLSMLTNQYIEIEKKKMSSEGMVKILKRLKIVVERRRVSRGREIRLDFDKLNSKLRNMGVEPKAFEKKEIQKALDFSNELDQKLSIDEEDAGE